MNGFSAGFAAAAPTLRDEHRRKWNAARRHQRDPHGALAVVQKLSPGFFGGRGTHQQRRKKKLLNARGPNGERVRGSEKQLNMRERTLSNSSPRTRPRGLRTSLIRVRVVEWRRQVTHDEPWNEHSTGINHSRDAFFVHEGGAHSRSTCMAPSSASARPGTIPSRKPHPRTVPVPQRAPCDVMTLIRRYLGLDVALTSGALEQGGEEGAIASVLLPSSRLYGDVSHHKDGDRDSAHGPKAQALPKIKCLQAQVGARIRMVFTYKICYDLTRQTWEGTVTSVGFTSIAVRWDDYPRYDLLVPPCNENILVQDLEIISDPAEAHTSTDGHKDTLVPEGKPTKKSSAGNALHDDANSVALTGQKGTPRATDNGPTPLVRYSDLLRLLRKSLEAESRALAEWVRMYWPVWVPLAWKAPAQVTLARATSNPEGRPTERCEKRCGGGTVPLEAPHITRHYRGMNPSPVPINEREQRCCAGCKACDARVQEEAERLAKMMPRFHPAFPGKGEVTLGGHETIEPSFVTTSGTTTMCWKGDGGSIIRPPEPRVERNKGILGAIVDNTINLAKVMELDFSGEATEVINILLDSVEFEKHLKVGFQPQTRISRFMSQHKEDMEESGVLEITPRDFGNNYMPLFTVPKKDDTLRLIQDGRHLNRWFDRPPQMNLPRIHEVIDMLMRNEYFAQCDARSWFYQIPLCKGIRKYFGVILGGGRGDLHYGVMTKIPMGFSWAPCIAQRISNVLMRNIGLAWVDNYIIVGKTPEDFESNRRIFLERIDPVTGCNVVVDDTELKPVRNGETLGIEVNLETKTYRMSPKWAEKVAARGIPELWTPRAFSQSMGGIIWCSHVTRRGLCMQPHLMSVLGDMMRKIALRQIKWDDDFPVTDAAKSEMVDVLRHIEKNEPIQWREGGIPDMEIWSDASDTHAAYLIIQYQEVIASLVRETRGEHIFLEELSIALDAVAKAYELGATRARLFCDNAPAGACIEKNVSTNFVANTRLRARAPLPVDVTWVSTKYELADPYTRGIALPEVSCPAKDLKLYDAAMTNPQLRELGKHTFEQTRPMCVCEGTESCQRCRPMQEKELRAEGTYTFKQSDLSRSEGKII